MRTKVAALLRSILIVASLAIGRIDATNTLYAVGGKQGSPMNVVEKYDAQSNTFATVAPMATDRSHLATAVVDNRIFAIGGWPWSVYGLNSPASSVESYNPSEDKWSPVAPMPDGRWMLAAASVGGHIYATGGADSETIHATVYKYDPTGNSWTTVAPMATERSAHAAVALNDSLYVLGGTLKNDDRDFVSSVERFDPSTGEWSQSTPMKTPRANFGCAVFEAKIFVAGGKGRDGESFMSSVESFDPADGQWSAKGDLSSVRRGMALAVVDGRLLAVGGYNDTGYLTLVEEYVPETNSWRHVADTTTAHSYFGVAVVDV